MRGEMRKNRGGWACRRPNRQKRRISSGIRAALHRKGLNAAWPRKRMSARPHALLTRSVREGDRGLGREETREAMSMEKGRELIIRGESPWSLTLDGRRRLRGERG